MSIQVLLNDKICKNYNIVRKLKIAISRSRRLHFKRFDNQSIDLDEIYRSKVSIRFGHSSSSWSRNCTKNTNSECWESGDLDFEHESFWVLDYLEMQRNWNSFILTIYFSGLLLQRSQTTNPETLYVFLVSVLENWMDMNGILFCECNHFLFSECIHFFRAIH